MKRLAFLICWLCLAAIGSEAGAQGATDLPRVAILSPDPPTAADPASGYPLAGFLEALDERGYVDGRNIPLDFRFAENRLDRLPALAAELVKARPAVIYTYTTVGANAAAGATTSIPIVVGPVGEQTMEQLAGSFAKPVANVTGFTLSAGNPNEKCLQLLKEAAPALSRIGVLLNPDNVFALGRFDYCYWLLLPVRADDCISHCRQSRPQLERDLVRLKHSRDWPGNWRIPVG